MLLVGWGLVGLSSYLVYLLMRSPWGRVVKGIREDEDAMRSLGKNVNFYKMQSLILGGVIGALGGILFAISRQSVQPDNYSTALTFFAYTALILGGTAKIFGPILGSMIFWALLSFTDVILRQAVSNDYIPDDLLSGTRVGIIRFILVGVALILLMVFRPQGILGDKKEVAIGERRLSRRADPIDLSDVERVPGSAKPDPILVADGVRRTFGGLVAVDVDHVEVQRGTITALIGPNGAGKTTFFNLLTGFDKPDEGRWSFDGEDLAGVPPTRWPARGWCAPSS